MALARVCNAFVKQNGLLSSVQFHFSNIYDARAQKRALPKGYRPPTPFSLLTKEVYQAGMSIGEVGKLAAKKWAGLAPEKLQSYKEQAEKIGKDRKKEFELLSKTEKEALYAKQDAQRKIRKIRAELLHPAA